MTFEEVQQHKKFHDFDVRSSLTGEIFATNREQVEAMIEYLWKIRRRMRDPVKR